MGEQAGQPSTQTRACPFREPASDGCAAAPGQGARGRKGAEHRCATPEHGDCALYLVKLLTSLKPHPFAGQRDLWSK